MRHYALTRNLTLVVKPCRPVFDFFVGKTNRLALVSMSLCGVALDFYYARQWQYPAWEQESEYWEDDEVAPMSQTRPASGGSVVHG